MKVNLCGECKVKAKAVNQFWYRQNLHKIERIFWQGTR